MEKISTKEIPENPGIYIFKDKYNDPLYVGKAKNLRKRVPSYFRENTTWKIKRLTSEATEISFITSKNEADALLGLVQKMFLIDIKNLTNLVYCLT